MKQIMIVEDEQALRNAYVMIFQSKGYTVVEAPHGQKALEELETTSPNIIILDLLMPVLGGIEFLEKANLKSKMPATKVLVLSNLSDASTLERLEELKVDKYLLKASVSPSELVKAVSDLIERN